MVLEAIVYAETTKSTGEVIKDTLEEHGFKVHYHVVRNKIITSKEIRYLLRFGGKSIISPKKYEENIDMIEEMEREELVRFLVLNKNFLRLPLVVTKGKVMVGYRDYRLDDFIKRTIEKEEKEKL